ncbi:Undecaprenyl pyrophosphate synthetase [Anaerobranca californiensis DSM 14826]|jgi:undecaprenyl diphosphate synthase|uniref:Isoprenyl transferase n=1 Tax=Anaerobranca californiensis DSM 14826 TaxID=1120989 RepID=A0A1M6KFR5_9FIRM|nr:isoprenyl transferase [Anaerobranca californiensis]SHJ57774.1 Undecaprenyl pyrophosphate synthetase [Anaerobranca californiensis DSM 14826]
MLFKRNLLEKVKKSGNIPKTIAIIMDGNGRWAQKRGLPRTAGHKMGVETVKKITESCIKLGIENVILYAFSTENWKRPKEEVEFLMKLPEEYLSNELDKIIKNNIKIETIGDLDKLPLNTKNTIEIAKSKSVNNNGLTLIFAINYGSRQEILDAAKEFYKNLKADNLDELKEEDLAKFLETKKKDIPDPDLLIRPGGELRISNFLLWQLAYTELYFTPVLWPDFTEKHLCEAIMDYQRRNRRFGGLKN